MIEGESIMADKVLVHLVKSIGPRTEPRGAPECTGARQNNDWIERRTVYDQSDKMKAFEVQHQ